MDARSRSLRKYGLRLLDYDEMVKAQDGRCRICGTTASGIAGEVWAVDHDHVTKRVRALLCSDCNAGLGLFDDDPERLRAAAEYSRPWSSVSAGRSLLPPRRPSTCSPTPPSPTGAGRTYRVGRARNGRRSYDESC
jgi:hypothetical protein